MYSLYTVCDLKVHTSARIIISWACVGTAGSFLKLIQRHVLIVYGSTVGVHVHECTMGFKFFVSQFIEAL